MNQPLPTVLMVDDDSFFSDVIGNKLHAEGMVCVYAPTGAIAFDLLKTTKPACILLDYRMPDMTGIEVLKRLKKCRVIE